MGHWSDRDCDSAISRLTERHGTSMDRLICIVGLGLAIYWFLVLLTRLNLSLIDLALKVLSF